MRPFPFCQYRVTTLGPIGSKITSFWNLSEVAFTTRADSLGLNPATDASSNISTGVGPKGGVDVAASFPGGVQGLDAGGNSSTRINVATPTGGGDHAIFGWAYLTGVTTNQELFSEWDGVSQASLPFMINVGASVARMYNGGSSYYNSTASITASAWHFIYGQRDHVSGGVSISVDNGALSTASAATNPPIGYTNHLILGSGDGTSQPLTGRLSRWGWIKGNTLTSSERTTMYNGGPSGALSWADIVSGGL